MNQYTSTPCDFSRTYDLNGNLISIIYNPTTIVNMAYDYRNQMIRHTDVGTSVSATYAYDALGRRIAKTTGSPPQTTRYFYDHWRLVEEQDIAGTTQGTVLYGNPAQATHGETNDAILGSGDDDNVFYYHTDDMHNTMAVTDETGAVVERYEYEDYGEPSFFDSTGGPITASAIGNPYLFTGRRYDTESGWYNSGASYFDPIAGRFITRQSDGLLQYAQNSIPNESFLETGDYSLKGHAALLTFTIGPPASPLFLTIAPRVHYNCTTITNRAEPYTGGTTPPPTD